MKIIAETYEEFFENSGAHRESVMALDEFIRTTVPELERKLYSSNTITTIGYGEIPYKKGTGDANDMGPILAIAPQKNNISFYVMAWKDGVSLPERYVGKLGKTSHGKCCIRFRKYSSLDLEELKNLLLETYEIYCQISR